MFCFARWFVLITLFFAPRIYVLNRDPLHDRPHCELELAAASLANNGFLGNCYHTETGPTAHVAPVYASFLALIYKCFGTGQTAHLVQAIFSTLITFLGVALMPRLSKLLFESELPGWIGAISMCLLPYSIGYVQVFGHWEQHVSFMAVMLYLPALISISRSTWNSTGQAFRFGIFSGILALTSPQFLLVFLLFVASEFIRGPERLRLIKPILISGIMAGIVIAPWTIRNAMQLHGFCLIRSNGGLELAVGNHDLANGTTYTTRPKDENSPIRAIHPFTNPAHAHAIIENGELAYMKQRGAEAVHWIQEHPQRFLELTWNRFRYFWFPTWWMWAVDVGDEHALRMRALSYGIPSALMVIGLVMLFFRNHRNAMIIISVILGMSGAYYITHVDMRYVFPLHGVILTLASAPFAIILKRVLPTSWIPS